MYSYLPLYINYIDYMKSFKTTWFHVHIAPVYFIFVCFINTLLIVAGKTFGEVREMSCLEAPPVSVCDWQLLPG